MMIFKVLKDTLILINNIINHPMLYKTMIFQNQSLNKINLLQQGLHQIHFVLSKNKKKIKF